MTSIKNSCVVKAIKVFITKYLPVQTDWFFRFGQFLMVYAKTDKICLLCASLRFGQEKKILSSDSKFSRTNPT